MTHQTTQALRIALVLGALATACTEDRPTSPNTSDVTGTQQGALVPSRANIPVPEARMRALLKQVTREVAMAAADPQVRAMVYRELHASPYREHKLHFGPFLRNEGGGLLVAMAAVRRSTPDRVLASLDSIVDLEFYVPIKEHFATWDGNANLFVASVLHDDGTIPDGYDLTGRAIRFVSAEVPPATPVLAVVPAETNFSMTPPLAPRGVDAAVSDVAGAYMTEEHIYDDHEGWLMGDPEFEVHTFVRNIDALYQDVVCAGKAAPSPYQYDADLDWWGNGIHDVLLATDARIASANDSVQFHIWEDDTGECTGEAGSAGGKPPKTTGERIQQLSSWASSLINGVKTFNAQNGTFFTRLSAALAAVPVVYNLVTSTFRDDEVGVLVLPNNCFSAATGPVYYEIRESGAQHLAGWAKVDFRFGDERSPICPTPPPPPPPPPAALSVTISGPNPVQPYSTCLYTALAQGGSGTYSYAWTADGTPVGDDSPYYRHSAGASAFTLEVVVTDTEERETGAVFSVAVDAGAQECLDQ